MQFSRRRFVSALSSAIAICAVKHGLAVDDATAKASSPQVICAGGAELFVLDLAAAEKGELKKLWTWSASDVAGLSAEWQKRFRNLDECKPVDGGKKILVCASNSGCGLIERETGKLLWQAAATNAHSLEMLPGERIAVASSLSGDQLLIFDRKSEKPDVAVWKTPLHSAHGLVWDEERASLWALGYDELRRYELQDWKSDSPALQLKDTFRLPDADGHDLRPVPNSKNLVLTTKASVQLFDRTTHRFRPHPLAGTLEGAKAFDVHPETGRIVYSTWGQKFNLLNPDAPVPTKGNTVYKVRWFPASKGTD